MRAIDLVVTDLDGTLWRHEGEVDPRVMTAWRELEADGIAVLVATGRRAKSTRLPLASIGVVGPAVLLDGTLGVDFVTGERFHHRGITTEDAVRILAVFEEHGISPVVYLDGDGPDLRISSQTSANPGIVAAYGSDVMIADLDEVVATESVLSFGLVGVACEPVELVAADVVARGYGAARVNPSFDWGGCALTVVRPEVSKWDGVVAYCEWHGIDPSRVLAIGDGSNDVEMLERAAISCSLTGAHPLAVAAADHIVSAVTSAGWSELLAFV